jgi:hypothetical protein
MAIQTPTALIVSVNKPFQRTILHLVEISRYVSYAIMKILPQKTM